MAADVLTISSVWAICVLGYWALGFGSYAPMAYLKLWPLIPLSLILNMFTRTYQGHALYPAMPLAAPEEFRRLFLNALLAHLVLAALIGFTRSIAYSRLLIVISGVLTACSVQIVRDLVRAMLKRGDFAQIPVLLAGAPEMVRRVKETLDANAYLGLRAFLHEGESRRIVDAARERDIRILITCQDPRLFRAQMEDFVKWFHQIEYLPSTEAFPVADGRAISIEGLGGLEMVNQTRMKAMHLQKSVLDRTLAAIIFICAIPAFLVVPILIKLTSRGPVFYRANRLGKHGRPIRVWKFRSMYRDADQRLQSLLDSDLALKSEFERDFKLKNDPRVTPLGKILRKTSIDELPQLFNVFTGEMALVGPRPIVEKEIPYYGKAFEIFSSVKPGITGLWQASGRSDTDYPHRVALDVHYVLNWSPWMDLWIVFRTAAAVLKMKGSY